LLMLKIKKRYSLSHLWIVPIKRVFFFRLNLAY
jgi:hypothetical protein